MFISQIWNEIENFAPLAAAAHWDRSGLQVASRRTEASCLAVCLDPVPASILASLSAGADCILSHHPLSLEPRLPNVLDAYHESLSLLLGSEVPLYAAHTSLDANPRGPAGWLAQVLDMHDAQPLEVTHEAGAQTYGFGQSGNLDRPMTIDEIAEILGSHVDMSMARLCGPRPHGPISRIAYCPGSGGSLLGHAAARRVQLYITGDMRYHSALDATICVLDVGHHSLEEEMMRRFSLDLERVLSGCKVKFVPSVSPFYPLAGGA